MDKCVKRTVQAIYHNEKIGIFGDYDVDGASSTALLANYFNDLLKKQLIFTYLIEKLEGFGPSKTGFKKLTQNGSNLIFTVDCGTLSFDTIDYYQKKNIDVLVLDHHQSETKLPNAHFYSKSK